MTQPFDRCPVCGGELLRKEVEKLVRRGSHTAAIVVHAHVCLGCGERLYDPNTVRMFEDVRGKLQRLETGEFEQLGQSFQIRWPAS